MTEVAQPGGRRLDGVRAVVTGASSGIGAAIAEAFGGAGATVLVTHRDSAEGASAVAERIARRGGRALLARADLVPGTAVRRWWRRPGNGSADSTCGSTTRVRTC